MGKADEQRMNQRWYLKNYLMNRIQVFNPSIEWSDINRPGFGIMSKLSIIPVYAPTFGYVITFTKCNTSKQYQMTMEKWRFSDKQLLTSSSNMYPSDTSFQTIGDKILEFTKFTNDAKNPKI
jgi:hypothetical protein